MVDLQLDVFGNGKSTEEVQIDAAIFLLLKYGYRVIKTAEEAKKLAIDSGYKVIDPIIVDEHIITIKDLHNYFYKQLWNKYPNRQPTYFESNWKSELRIFKLFVESREDTGLNKFNAIQECIKIIDTIFSHADEFNFKNPIDVRVLGQDKSGWITNKALSIINEQQIKDQAKELDDMMIKMDEERKINLKEKASELDDLLARMEVSNGKKEKR